MPLKGKLNHLKTDYIELEISYSLTIIKRDIYIKAIGEFKLNNGKYKGQ